MNHQEIPSSIPRTCFSKQYSSRRVAEFILDEQWEPSENDVSIPAPRLMALYDVVSNQPNENGYFVFVLVDVQEVRY